MSPPLLPRTQKAAVASLSATGTRANQAQSDNQSASEKALSEIEAFFSTVCWQTSWKPRTQRSVPSFVLSGCVPSVS